MESDNVRILIDAGLGAREIAARMQTIDRSPEDLDAVFLTHEHGDHIRGAGPLARRYGLPVYSTEGSYAKMKHVVGKLPDWRVFKADDEILLGDLCVQPYETEHDGVEPVAFVVECGSRKLGHATDMGCAPDRVRQRLQNCQALLLEANHDPEMLDAGPYPWSLKQRVRSDVGHLSNDACADLLTFLIHDDLQRVTLMHLSATNNLPEIALLTARQALNGSPVDLGLARQDAPTELFTIS